MGSFKTYILILIFSCTLTVIAQVPNGNGGWAGVPTPAEPAEEEVIENDGYNQWAGGGKDGESVFGKEKPIVTYTSEPCGIAGEEKSAGETTVSNSKSIPPGQKKLYRCEVTASDGFTKMVQNAYRFVFFISLIIGVLYIVVMGIILSMSGVFGVAEEKKGDIKKKIVDVIIGLFALALIPWILKTIAPFFFK